MSWLAVIVYVLGLPIAFRTALRRRMLEPICERCYRDPLHAYSPYLGPGDSSSAVIERQRHEYAPRGSVRDRDALDLHFALLRASRWPLHGAIWVALLIRDLIADGVGSLTDRLVPLTTPELERRIAEQQAEINRLTEQIGAQS